MQTPLYINTSCIQPSQSHYSHLLSLISAHPDFKSKVNSFLLLFSYDIQSQDLIKMGTLIYALLLPQFPKNLQRKLAVELFNILQTHHDKVTYTNLSEYLLKICSDLVENIDVRSAIGILDLIQSRIVDHFIIDAQNPQIKKKIQTNIKLQLFDSENVITESELPERYHRKAFDLLYFEEKLQFQNDIQVQPNQIIVKKLKQKPDEIIPLGYVYQQFCFDYINSNFETKNSYRIKGNKNIIVNDKVQYWVSLNNNAGNALRDKVVNQQTFYACPVLSMSHLPQTLNPSVSKKINLYRINQVFAKASYYQKLKEAAAPTAPSVSGGNNKYFNILSEFYDRDEFNIDQLTLTKEKFIIRRKQQALGIQGKQAVKKQVKDYQDEARILPQRISKTKFEYLVQKRMQQNIKDLSKILRAQLQQDKNINAFIQKNLSASLTLPKDSNNAYKQDIINLAHKDPLQILIYGRAKSGKSTLAKAIAKQYNITYISVESAISKVLERSNFFKENPPEADEDGNVKGGLLKIQECVINDLQNGRKISEEDILDLVNIELKKQSTLAKGFILDLPFQYSDFWYFAIKSNKIHVPKVGCRFFNRIVQIQQTEEEWAQFVNGLLIKPDDLATYSSLDLYLRMKPKPAPQQGQQQQQQQQEKPVPLIESNLLKVMWQKSTLPLIQHITNQMHPLHYLKVRNSYRSVNQCLQYLKFSLYKIPLAKKLQGNQKQLLTIGLQEQKLARKWSPWGIVDCVQLNKQKLLNGKFQFAAQYSGRVFLFENQNNLNLFLKNPRKYVQNLPKLPKKTNIVLAGPRKSGKRTLAHKLHQIYGLKIIDFEQILKTVISKQKHDEVHLPSNPDKTSKAVHLSESQFKQFTKGGLLNAKDVLPIILYQLGIPLQKKPPNWGVQNIQAEGGGEEAAEEKKAVPKKAKKKQTKNQDDANKIPPLEDLSLKQIIPTINHKGKLDEIKGYIFVGFPHNEEQLSALKTFNIPIDKYILLSDNSEENPYKTLSKRLSDNELEQLGNFMNNIGPIKQALGEEVFKQINNLQQTPDQIINKIRQFIDPFYAKPDEDSLNRVLADKQQDGDPIPLGFCGEYCPVTLHNKWLMKGKEEFEAGYQGKRYKFVGENQLNNFKSDPAKYINKQNLSIPPRIMFIGIRGVGLKTQLLKLNQKYKIPILNFKDNLIQQLDNEKFKRKNERYYNKGFKIPQFDEEGKQIQDPQLNQEAADFDKAALEVEIVKKMFNGLNEIFINGNFFDVEQQAVQTPFVDLLANARKLPETVFILKSQQNKWLERNLDKKKIQQQLQEIKKRKRAEKIKEREQAKSKALDAGEQYQQPPQQNQQQDPEIPKLQDMIAQKQQALKGQRQADSNKLDELAQAFKAWNVEVVQVKCQRESKHVNDRIVSAIKPLIEERESRWELSSMLPIQRHRTKDFIDNYIALNSRFGQLNPFTLLRPVLSYPLIYNDRIYYLNDEEQRESVMRKPKLLQTNQSIPHDVSVVPSVAIIGLPKTGKTTLVDGISKKIGLIKLSLDSIIQDFCIEHRDERVNAILKQIKKGKVLSDQMIVDIIEKRVSMSDCQKYGWVFDGFPNTRQQCEILNKRGLLPNKVFSIKLHDLEIKKRAININLKHSKLEEYDYDFDLQIIHERLLQNKDKLLEVQVYFQTKFNSLQILDGKVSKWGLFEHAKNQIQKKIKSRKQFVRSLVTHSATPASEIGLNFNCIISNLSQYQNFCPISYKIRRQYVKICPKHHKYAALYNKKIYLLASQKELNDFINNPESYKSRGPSFNPPSRIQEQQILSISQKVQNKGYCVVELSRKKLVKGCLNFTLKYKNKYFVTSTATNMKLFVRNPVLFEMTKLQDKLPVQFQKKNDLKKLAKQNDCTAFLEHHLSNILMKSLAQLGYRRPKFPTLGSKQSALKFLSISLKANNPNKNDEYRQKYSEKLERFIKQCSYSHEIRQQLDKKSKGRWDAHDEQNLLKLCQEYHKFLNQTNSIDKNKYFSQFIR